jgi:hypothetical protein
MTGVTKRLCISRNVEPTSPQWHDVVAHGGDLDVTLHTERLLSKERMAHTHAGPTAFSSDTRALVFGTARTATRSTRTRRGHWHQQSNALIVAT